FTYRPNRSTDDAISTTLHLALTHLDNRDTYVRMLFIDFSSAFNTIIPQHLIGKLILLGLNTPLSNWILDFLTGRPQSVRIGQNTSSTTTLSTGDPQGCVLSPLSFTLLTHDCAAMHSSNHIIKFSDDTTVVGLISKNDESAYREEVQRLTDWCRTNNLSLNVDKTKEMVVDFRRTRRDHSPLHIDGSTVEIVKSTKFLGVHLAEDLTWSLNTSTITKKAQQRLYFLRRLRKAHLPPLILTTFYRGTIESILSSCITAWFGNCTASDPKSLQRVVKQHYGMLGRGVYLSRDLNKASRYPLHLPEHERVVLRVLVNVGKVIKIDRQGHPLQRTWHNHGLPSTAVIQCTPSDFIMWAENDLGPGIPCLESYAEPSNGKVYLMYHGTSRSAAMQIMRSGFKPSAGGMLGPGVYLSRDLNKASRYPLNLPEHERVVLRVQVNVGRVKKIDHQGHPMQMTWHRHGYDTAWCPPRCGMVPSGLEEDCVWDPNHIKVIDAIYPNVVPPGPYSWYR
ncbi:hypothetical protein NFI96_026787, partial [Prochilodus magdalenae]